MTEYKTRKAVITSDKKILWQYVLQGHYISLKTISSHNAA